MKYCQKCGKEIPENSIFCPECGCSTPKANEEKAKLSNKNTLAIIAAIFIILATLAGLAILFFYW